ncbi:hypothetical protein MRX96_042911 [Rhipicephalus microplus]
MVACRNQFEQRKTGELLSLGLLAERDFSGPEGAQSRRVLPPTENKGRYAEVEIARPAQKIAGEYYNLVSTEIPKLLLWARGYNLGQRSWLFPEALSCRSIRRSNFGDIFLHGFFAANFVTDVTVTAAIPPTVFRHGLRCSGMFSFTAPIGGVAIHLAKERVHV